MPLLGTGVVEDDAKVRESARRAISDACTRVVARNRPKSNAQLAKTLYDESLASPLEES